MTRTTVAAVYPNLTELALSIALAHVNMGKGYDR
jgi:hypothetical protein